LHGDDAGGIRRRDSITEVGVAEIAAITGLDTRIDGLLTRAGYALVDEGALFGALDRIKWRITR
jgi:hypothetical protein